MAINEMVKGEIRKKVLHYNEQAFNDSASLRYLANTFPGVIFKNGAGLMDVSFEVDEMDTSNDGEVKRIKIKEYQSEKFIAEITTLKEVDDNTPKLASYGNSEVKSDLGDLSDWIEEQIDRELYQDLQELPEVNIEEVE